MTRRVQDLRKIWAGCEGSSGVAIKKGTSHREVPFCAFDATVEFFNCPLSTYRACLNVDSLLSVLPMNAFAVVERLFCLQAIC
jgi:hypothetical protein